MIEYHLFEICDKNYIYFPEYQQGFEISDKFAKYLEYTTENNEKNNLLKHITKVFYNA
jgi:hypothetical protein